MRIARVWLGLLALTVAGRAEALTAVKTATRVCKELCITDCRAFGCAGARARRATRACKRGCALTISVCRSLLGDDGCALSMLETLGEYPDNVGTWCHAERQDEGCVSPTTTTTTTNTSTTTSTTLPASMAFPASMTFPACPSCYSGVGSVTLEDSRPDATTTGLRCRYVHWFPEYARGLVALGMTANSHGGASTRLGGGQFTVAMADGSERPIWFCSQDVSPGLPCAPYVDLVADGFDPYTAGGPGRITFELLLDTGTSDPAAMQAVADSIVAVHYAGDYAASLALDPDVNEPTCPYDPGRGF